MSNQRIFRRLAVSTRNGLVQSVPQNILGCGNLLCAVVEEPPPDPAILAQFSFVAAATEGGVGVFWGLGPEVDNAVPPPAGQGNFDTFDSEEGLMSFGFVEGLPGASECPLRIEIFQNGEPFTSVDLAWDSGTDAHTSGGPDPVSAVMVVGESYTGLIRQLPCD